MRLCLPISSPYLVLETNIVALPNLLEDVDGAREGRRASEEDGVAG